MRAGQLILRLLFCVQVFKYSHNVKTMGLRFYHYGEQNDSVEKSVESGMRYQVVFPQLYHLSRRKKRYIEYIQDEEPLTSLLLMKAFGQVFYIELEPSENIRISFDGSLSKEFGEIVAQVEDKKCLLQGKVLNMVGAAAAISMCSGDGMLDGLLLTPSGSYILSPSASNLRNDNQTFGSSKFPAHVLLRHEEEKHFCAVGSGSQTGSKQPRSYSPGRRYAGEADFRRSALARLKRADVSNRKVMEVAVFVDSDLYSIIEASTDGDPRRATLLRVLGIMNQSRAYRVQPALLATFEDAIQEEVSAVTTEMLLNEVQLIYNYATLDTKFKLVIVKLEILKSESSSPNNDNGNIDNYLDNFCNWQSKLNVREGQSGHWDHAIMLTGLDLYKFDGVRKNSKVLGLAWVNGMCRSNYSCTLNEGTSFEAAFVIAHEMGHNLGIMHDGSGNNCDRNKYIMSDKTGPGKVNWSTCSNVYIKKFFRNGYGWCLEDDASPPNRSYNLQVRGLPGSRFSLAEQCALALGPQYAPHQENKEPFNNVCRELWCASGSWAKPAHPALEGSPCGARKHCIQGSCRLERPDTLGAKSNNSSSASSSRGTLRSSRRSQAKSSANISDDMLEFIRRSVLKMIKSMG